MPRIEVTMSNGYQVVVPSLVRKMLSLKPQDKVVFDTDKGAITVEKGESHEEKIKRAFAELDEWRENLPDETKEKIKQHAGWTAKQYREYIDNLPETKAYMKEKYGV